MEKSQTIILDSSLNKFVGTWRWTSGTDTIEVVLEKQTLVIPWVTFNREGLVGWHRYVKNGVVLQSSFEYLGRNINLDFNSQDSDLKTTL